MREGECSISIGMVHPRSSRLNEAVAIVLIGDLIPVCRRTMRAHGRLGLCAFFGLVPELWRFSVSKLFSPQPPVTRAVETVEKVPFRKLIFGKCDKNIGQCLVFCVPNNILAILRPLWEIFVQLFQAKSFSTVSLGARNIRLLQIHLCLSRW